MMNCSVKFLEPTLIVGLSPSWANVAGAPSADKTAAEVPAWTKRRRVRCAIGGLPFVCCHLPAPALAHGGDARSWLNPLKEHPRGRLHRGVGGAPEWRAGWMTPRAASL